MDYETVLKEETFKGDGLDPGQRAFYTLTKPTSEHIRAQRTTKLLCELVGHLVNQQRLSETELDTILFNTTR